MEKWHSLKKLPKEKISPPLLSNVVQGPYVTLTLQACGLVVKGFWSPQLRDRGEHMDLSVSVFMCKIRVTIIPTSQKRSSLKINVSNNLKESGID